MAKLLLGIAESAESEQVRLQAVKHVLAVGGINEKASVEIEHSLRPFEEIIRSVSGSRDEYRAAQGLPPLPPPPPWQQIVDAEVIEEPVESGAHFDADARTAPAGDLDRAPTAETPTDEFPGLPLGYMPMEVALDRLAESTVRRVRRRRE